MPPEADVADPAVVEPAVAPEVAAPAPAAAPAATMESAAAAMHARVLGDETPEELIPDGATYRDVVPLRESVTAVRQEFKALADAFGGLSEDDRTALLSTAPSLGSDLPYIAQAFSGLEPEDRKVIAEILTMIPEDPTGAGELLAQAAGLLRGDDGAAPPAPAGDAPTTDALGFELTDPNRPLTQADVAKMLGDFATNQEQMRHDRAQWDAVQQELKTAGYDPVSKDPLEKARVHSVIELAKMLPNGSVTQAHEMLAKAHDAKIQEAIDQYVAGKSANAARPQPFDGGAPSDGSRVLVSLDDAAKAMSNRLDGMGVARRR